MSKNKATVTILEGVTSRNINTKNGPKTVYSQRASVETEAMRVQEDVEVDGPNMGYPVGAVYEWDLPSDLVPGKYGTELARRKTLIPVAAANADAPKLGAVK